MMKGGHSQSTAMAEILNPTNGFRGSLKAKGIKPKNHMAANRQFLRKQEQIIKDQKEEMNNTKSKQTPNSWLSDQSILRSSRALCHEKISKCGFKSVNDETSN